jgi:sulfur carrier protein
VRLNVNGEARTVPDPANLADLVSTVTDRTAGIAVAVNGDVVPRTRWPEQALADGDAIEILTAVQGG